MLHKFSISAVKSKLAAQSFMALVAAVTASFTTTAMAADFPNKPISVIVPYGAGGGTDTTGRFLAKEAEKYLPQPIAIINRSGGSGTVGTAEAAAAKADGYTLYFGASDALVTSPHSLNVPYTVDNFRGIVGVSYAPSSIAVRTDSPWETLEDFLAEAGTDTVVDRGHSGVGGVHHTLMKSLFAESGVKFRDVPFQGGSQAIAAIRGGHVDLIGGTPGSMVPSIEAGETRLLAVSSEERLDSFPDVPTFKEKGLDLVATVEWYLLAPKETPDDVIAVLEDAFLKAANSDEFKAFTVTRKQESLVRNGEEIMAKLNRDWDFFGSIINP
ncbi:Bug family tripartite tricarboxylate transporter substrate binding protein [Pacificibacter marinus]|uniref:Bug family tripartite tricarboxylate transporter substrate binding protein n=1 Tax=Pacificibacter marinus TaxID=658057 RepID=UPI001C07C7F7|nr:tripartite tricarboxylate transporter substrate binding protein [Pacificibacter marinus]MBU2868081.1 tripartite tricarboxylate transporter substrate binding protein [Pacificibacter marinus]